MALRFNGRDAWVMIQILSDLFDNSRHSVARLELGDTYGQITGYQSWQKGIPSEEISGFEIFRPWVDLVRRNVDRGSRSVALAWSPSRPRKAWMLACWKGVR
jgi:hypothetical protein